MPRGQFRQTPVDAESMAYVAMPIGGNFITESLYRARGYQPRFEALPSQEEYEAAAEKQAADAGGGADIASGKDVEEFETLALAMARYGENSKAWQDFAADCHTRRIVERNG